MELITRAEARAAGLKTYFTGRPCKYGHIRDRRVSTADCIECSVIRSHWAHAKNKKLRNAQKRTWQENNRDKQHDYQRAYQQNNPDKMAAKSAKRRAANLERTVAWANQTSIVYVYRFARLLTTLTGIQYHVDHVIPLRGELVSGLHCEDNLRIIPGKENLKKGKRH